MLQPLGVVGIVVPWNYPIYLAIGPLACALAAGNRVMIKMSESAPATGALFARWWRERFSRDVVTVVNGGADVGARSSRRCPSTISSSPARPPSAGT